jgi:pimeloyl-ACP methyl ester carboxylesterase
VKGFPQGRDEALAKTKLGSGCELLRLQTRQGTKIVAEFASALDDLGRPVANPEQQPTLIFFYGNGMCVQHALSSSLIDYFRRMGVNVLMPDYPGYGMSEGRSTEKGVYATAEAAYACLTTRPGIWRDQIIVSGFSLGTAPALYLASRRPVAGLMLFGAFTNAKEMGRAHAPRSLRWLIPAFTVWRPINNLAKIRAVSCPTLIIHGTADTTAPIEMADRLAAAAVAAKVTRLSIAGAEHDVTWNIGGIPLWKAIDGWVHNNPSGYLTLEADTFLITLARKGHLPGQAKGNDEIDGTLEGDGSAAYPASRTFKFHGVWANVTPKIKSLAAKGPVSIPVNNDLAGRDPAPNIVKQLRVVFRRDGHQQTTEAAEGGTLVLPARADVTTALYGKLRGRPADGSICHYTVVRESDGSPWKLQKAWRTDANGRVVEKYPIP